MSVYHTPLESTHTHTRSNIGILLLKKKKKENDETKNSTRSATRIITSDIKERERWIREAKAISNRVSVRRRKTKASGGK